MSRPLANVGVPEPPPGEFFRWVRNQILNLQSALLPPAPVTNFRATPLPGAIQIDFTRSDGDGYTLMWNTTASLQEAVHIDLGTSNKYVDDIGDAGVTRFYIVRSRKGSVMGDFSPWLSATTLALTVAATPPTPPPATDVPFQDQELDIDSQAYAHLAYYKDL